MVLSPPGSFWELSWPPANHVSKGFNTGSTWDGTWSADRRKAVKVIPISIVLTPGWVTSPQANQKTCSRTSPKSHNSLWTARLPFPHDSFTREITYFSKDAFKKGIFKMWNSHLDLLWVFDASPLISHSFYFFITETFGISDVQDTQLIHASLACFHSN